MQRKLTVLKITALKAIHTKSSFFLCVLIIWLPTSAQSPYVLNGNAIEDNCHCYTLTKELEFQSASIWNKNKIDLSQPFDYSFDIYTGCLDSTGADGMSFVLQPFNTSIGAEGAGLGFQNIYPSLGVTIDTYQNTEQDDPYYDHISIQVNGDTYHKSINNLAGPVRVLENSDNIEDCKWHKLQIKWQPGNNLLQVSVDGNLRLSLQKDIVAAVFNNDPLVFWGFTAATGYLGNLQRVCTSLDAGFTLPNKNTCFQEPLVFSDTSHSFGNISNWYWDFGDKTTSNEQNPTHTYGLPGNYTVTLNVLGGEGCLSDTIKQQLTVGGRPVADFKMDTLTACSDQEIKFSDAASVTIGEKNYWYWNLGNGKISNEQNPSVNYSAGKYSVDFFVKTKQGCASDTVSKIITIKQSPSVGFAKDDVCIGSPVHFSAENFTDTIAIGQWHWNFDDNSFAHDPGVSHTYSKSGTYRVKLAAQAKKWVLVRHGCTTGDCL
jgi:PKD repeat protein